MTHESVLCFINQSHIIMIKRTLYFGNPALLSTKNAQLVFRQPDDKTKTERTFPIEDLGIVVLDHQQITITHGLMSRLLDNNCALITCNDRHMPTGLLLPLNGNSLQNERFRQQIDCSTPLRKQLWQQTIQAKIANQAAVLTQCVPGVQTGNMLAWVKQVKSDDSDNLEGRAAAYYWRNIFPEMTDFVRGRDEDYPNALLNYGYAILRAMVARSLAGCGLLPTLGIHHHNRYNAYCLADDIMEPYRPVVDRLVNEMIKQIPPEESFDLTTDVKRQLLAIPTIEVRIAGHRSPLMVAVETTTSSLQKCFAGTLRKIIYPEL